MEKILEGEVNDAGGTATSIGRATLLPPGQSKLGYTHIHNKESIVSRTVLSRLPLAGSVALMITLITYLPAQESGAVPTRDQVEESDTWNVADIFETDEAWEAAFTVAEGRLDDFARFEGQLGKSGAQLLAALKLRDGVGLQFEHLYSYAARNRDVDLGNSTNQSRAQRIEGLYTRFSSATAFMEPEIVAIDDKKLGRFMKKESGLKEYSHHLDDLRRQQAHVLPKEQEQIMALAQDITGGPRDGFSMLTNTDFTWGNIKDAQGQDVQMSRSRYYLYMTSGDRRVRHDAYQELYVPFQSHLNTLTTLLNAELKVSLFRMKARNYENMLEVALDGPNVPSETYHNLITAVNDNLEPLHRWAGIKKRVLGVDELHPYDTYAPLFPEVEKTYTYEEAQALVLAGLQPLGEEILAIVQRAFDERWIDVYENQGKRGGAYSSGTYYGVHPYILLNFNGTLDAVFTLAHELGHTMHSYLSAQNQPYIDSDYPTLAAEVASTANEALLMHYLLNNAQSDAEKLSLLQSYVQGIGITFYRQTRFAEFDLVMHEMVENGEPLTHEALGQVFGEMYQRYWGPEMVVDDEERMSWCRIPHYYYNYYMYSYAVAFAASQLVATRILAEGQPAVDDFIRFLSSGGSLYPIELLKLAGADMSTPAPIVATTERMGHLLDQMEEIIARK